MLMLLLGRGRLLTRSVWRVTRRAATCARFHHEIAIPDGLTEAQITAAEQLQPGRIAVVEFLPETRAVLLKEYAALGIAQGHATHARASLRGVGEQQGIVRDCAILSG